MSKVWGQNSYFATNKLEAALRKILDHPTNYHNIYSETKQILEDCIRLCREHLNLINGAPEFEVKMLQKWTFDLYNNEAKVDSWGGIWETIGVSGIELATEDRTWTIRRVAVTNERQVLGSVKTGLPEWLLRENGTCIFFKRLNEPVKS